MGQPERVSLRAVTHRELKVGSWPCLDSCYFSVLTVICRRRYLLCRSFPVTSYPSSPISPYPHNFTSEINLPDLAQLRITMLSQSRHLLRPASSSRTRCSAVGLPCFPVSAPDRSSVLYNALQNAVNVEIHNVYISRH